MKKIITHNRLGFINGNILVDDEDYILLSKYPWYLKDGYAATNITIYNKRKTQRMHRLIMGEPNGMQIDHIDHNKLNNQKNNLRIVTNSQNQMNKFSYKNSTSKYKGVSLYDNSNNWRSVININKKQIYLGKFNNEEDAAKAYNKAARELFGEYALLNEV